MSVNYQGVYNKDDIYFRKSPLTPLACLCGRKKIAEEREFLSFGRCASACAASKGRRIWSSASM
jgi:hypothetical protein